MEKQGGIYTRYSPGRDRDQTSTIEAQVAMCREKAQRDGVAIDAAHIYVDRDISGASVARAGFQAMLAAIEAGNFPAILYAKDDKRLFRNEREGIVWNRLFRTGTCYSLRRGISGKTKISSSHGLTEK